MFGYIKPQKGMLRVFEWEQYRAVYCGLCHALGEEFGFCARFLVNYDFTFLALILMRAGGERAQIVRRRCVAHPFCKRCAMTTSPALRAAAAASVILSHWQLCDAVEDKSFWRGIPARAARGLTRRSYRRARRKLPEFDRLVRGCLDELHALERARVASLDRPADTFARILAALSACCDAADMRRILHELFYHIGRVIYLTDALCDVEEDLKSGGYNPVVLRYSVSEAPLAPSVRDALCATIFQSVHAACAAAALLDAGSESGIIENILQRGIPEIVRHAAMGERPKKERRHERSI